MGRPGNAGHWPYPLEKGLGTLISGRPGTWNQRQNAGSCGRVENFRVDCPVPKQIALMPPDEDLLSLSNRLFATSEILKRPEVASPLAALARVAEGVADSWSGSWLGYHSRFYYEGLQPVPPGARFSKEWGTKDSWPIPGTIGNWIEYSFDFVRQHIEKEAGSPDLGFLEKEAISADEQFDAMKAQVLSRLSQAANDNPNDAFVKKLLESTEKLRTFDAADFVRAYEPKGKQMSRDMLAIEAGFETPPHFSVLADVAAIRSPFEASAKLAKLAQQAGSHLSRVVKQSEREERIGTNGSVLI